MASNEEQTCTIPGFQRISDLILITVCGIGLLICLIWATGWPNLHTKIFGISCYKLGFRANQVETEMTQEEVEKFEEDRRNLWNPEADSSHFD